MSVNEPLEKGIYILKAGSKAIEIFFGSNDSLYINWTSEKRKQDLKFGGTRMAENEYLKNLSDPENFNYLLQYAYTYKPAQFASYVQDEWEGGVKKIEQFRTVDNIKPSEDFIQLQKKLLAVSLLYLLDVRYPEVFFVYNPNDTLKYPSSVDHLRKQVTFNDASLIHNQDYIQYIHDYLQAKSQNQANKDSFYFSLANQTISSRIVKDAVFFQKLQSKLVAITDSARRSNFLSEALPAIRDRRYRQLLVEKSENMNSLQKGKKAQNFIAESLIEQEFDLNKLAGRNVVIDVWATWCVPCKKEAPFFEEFAEKYTNESIAFVALSIDEDKFAWKMHAMKKSKRVLQLWVKDAQEGFTKSYAVNSIPRFILIDAKGKIINSQMPLPSDPEFEAILQREIPALGEYY